MTDHVKKRPHGFDVGVKDHDRRWTKYRSPLDTQLSTIMKSINHLSSYLSKSRLDVTGVF